VSKDTVLFWKIRKKEGGKRRGLALLIIISGVEWPVARCILIFFGCVGISAGHSFGMVDGDGVI
jgi:hypothetical protein